MNSKQGRRQQRRALKRLGKKVGIFGQTAAKGVQVIHISIFLVHFCKIKKIGPKFGIFGRQFSGVLKLGRGNSPTPLLRRH